MKPITLLAATLLAGATPFLSAAAPSAPAWSFRFSLWEKKTPLQQELLKKFEPALGMLSHVDVFQQLAWIRVQGLADAGHAGDAGFIVHLHFRDDATAKGLLPLAGGKDRGEWEDVDGLPVLKLNTSVQINGGNVAYLAIPAARHLVLCSSRLAVETLAALPAESWLADPKEGELLSAEFDPSTLKAAAGKSELLGMLDGHLALNILSAGEYVNVQSSAELSDKRTANRARRILEGLVAAMATQFPASPAGPLDERLELTSDGKKLTGTIKLTNAEVERWLEAIEADLKTEIQIGAKQLPAK